LRPSRGKDDEEEVGVFLAAGTGFFGEGEETTAGLFLAATGGAQSAATGPFFSSLKNALTSLTTYRSTLDIR
jgi:hypothetical protein